MNDAIMSMMTKYNCRNSEDYENALKEIVQEVITTVLPTIVNQCNSMTCIGLLARKRSLDDLSSRLLLVCG